MGLVSKAEQLEEVWLEQDPADGSSRLLTHFEGTGGSLRMDLDLYEGCSLWIVLKQHPSSSLKG